jgi:cytochrome c553
MDGTLGALKLIVAIGLGVIVLLVLGAAATYVVSERRLNASIAVSDASIAVPTDIAAVQHGQHVAGAVAVCTRCHGPNLDGAVVVDDNAARVVAPNITRGGAVSGFSDADYVRAIRDGVGPDGHPLWLMPADAYTRLSELDLGALIAYLKSLPAVSSELPDREIRELGRVRLPTGDLSLLPALSVNHAAPRPAAPAPGVTPGYGEYLVSLAGCGRCHGPALRGGTVPGAPRGTPRAPDLSTAGLGDWSESDFLRAMRGGRRPDGSAIDTSMPWPYYAQMSDLELGAIWEYLGVIPAR